MKQEPVETIEIEDDDEALWTSTSIQSKCGYVYAIHLVTYVELQPRVLLCKVLNPVHVLLPYCAFCSEPG